MDRREFFQRGLKKATQTAVESADERVKVNVRWIRPPFALSELEFILACTRCNACIDACSYQVVFPLPTRVGIQAAGTPALDLNNRACQLCSNWPCVEVCQSGALKRLDVTGTESATVVNPGSESSHATLPRLASARIDPNLCLPFQGPECGACANVCPVPQTLEFDQERPAIREENCIGCAQCRDACVVQPKAIRISPIHHNISGKNQIHRNEPVTG